MTNPLRRSSRRPAPARSSSAPGPRAAYRVESLTQHWRVIGGHWYRDAIVVLPGGSRALFALLDERTAA